MATAPRSTAPMTLAELLPEDVLRQSPVVSYEKDQSLCRQGENATDALLIRSGLVRVVVLDPSGKQLLLAVRGAGELLGELAVIDGRPRSASIIALNDVTAARIPADQFRAAVARTPRLAVALLQMVTRRLRDTDARLVEQFVENTSTRLCRRLLELAAQHMRLEGDSVDVTVPLSQEQLAGLIGATRESTSKALSELRAQDVVATGRGNVTLLDLDRLRLLAAL